MSGRSLRRLPVLAHARYIGTMAPLGSLYTAGTTGARGKLGGFSSTATDVSVWLDAMENVVQKQALERERFQ